MNNILAIISAIVAGVIGILVTMLKIKSNKISKLEQARAMGYDDAEKDYYELNARTLLTTWGNKGGILNDYANRGCRTRHCKNLRVGRCTHRSSNAVYPQHCHQRQRREPRD